MDLNYLMSLWLSRVPTFDIWTTKPVPNKMVLTFIQVLHGCRQVVSWDVWSSPIMSETLILCGWDMHLRTKSLQPKWAEEPIVFFQIRLPTFLWLVCVWQVGKVLHTWRGWNSWNSWKSSSKYITKNFWRFKDNQNWSCDKNKRDSSGKARRSSIKEIASKETEMEIGGG